VQELAIKDYELKFLITYRIWVHSKGSKVTHSSKTKNTFTISKTSGAVRDFKQSPQGLFYIDTNDVASGSICISTIDDKNSNYTVKDYSQSLPACSIQQDIVDNNLLPNRPISWLQRRINLDQTWAS
jgi:hypothetical protein